MIPASMIDDMRTAADKRHRATIAAMRDAEVAAAHDAECAIVADAIAAGRDLPPYGWTLDRVTALQEERARRTTTAPPIAYSVPYVSIEQIDGVRLRYPVRCF